MAEFYDHPVTGRLHLRAPAGAGTGLWDAPATKTDIASFYKEHQFYLAGKQAAAAKAASDAVKESAMAEVKAESEALSAAAEKL
jgi:hypothetical protein